MCSHDEVGVATRARNRTHRTSNDHTHSKHETEAVTSNEVIGDLTHKN